MASAWAESTRRLSVSRFHSSRRGTPQPPWPTEIRVCSAPKAFPMSRHSFR